MSREMILRHHILMLTHYKMRNIVQKLSGNIILNTAFLVIHQVMVFVFIIL